MSNIWKYVFNDNTEGFTISNRDFVPSRSTEEKDMESFTIEDYEAEQERDMRELSNPVPDVSYWFSSVETCVEITSAVNGFVVKMDGWSGADYVTRYFIASNKTELLNILEQHQDLRNV